MQKDPSFYDSFHDRLSNANELKNYAISRGLDVPDDILRVISRSYKNLESDNLSTYENSAQLDIAIRDLTRITYPTTFETLRYLRNLSPTSQFLSKWGAPVFAVGAVSAAIWSFGQTPASKFSISILAASLGLLGALLAHLFNLIDLVEEKAVNAEDGYANLIKIFLGPIAGWIFYFGFAQKTFEKLGTQDADPSQSTTLPLLLLPFIAGFSARLVVGVLNQIIRATELTLGMENKKTDLVLRKRKIKEKPGQP